MLEAAGLERLAYLEATVVALEKRMDTVANLIISMILSALGALLFVAWNSRHAK